MTMSNKSNTYDGENNEVNNKIAAIEQNEGTYRLFRTKGIKNKGHIFDDENRNCRHYLGKGKMRYARSYVQVGKGTALDCIAARIIPIDYTYKLKFNSLSSDELTKGLFRNFFFIPPYMVTAFLSISSREPGDLACIAKAAAENLKINYDGYPEFNDKNHDEALKYILIFLWCCQKNS